MRHRRRTSPSNIATRPALGIVLLAAVLAFAPIPPGFVERVYVTGLYALFQPAVTFVSNIAPFAWLDLFAAAVVTLLVALLALDVARRGWWRAIVATAARIVVWSAALYVIFLFAWGFNYRRPRMTERLPYDASAVTPEGVSRLAGLTVERLNALHSTAHAEGWVMGGAIDPALAGAFGRAARDLGAAPQIVVGRPKHSVLDWYFQRAGVAGMTDPFFLETILAADLLPFERPFVMAHEWSHLAGFADEGEANYAGWLACLRGSTADQYSGWLFMYGEVLRAVPARDRAAIAGRLAHGPRDDLRAIRDRVERHVDPRMSAAGWRVYDSYLKANRVEAGTASYAEVVRLVLGLKPPA